MLTAGGILFEQEHFCLEVLLSAAAQKKSDAQRLLDHLFEHQQKIVASHANSY
jgi:hypothetical protein